MNELLSMLDALNIKALIISGLTLSAGGVVGFWIKDFPKKIFELLKRQFVTSMSVNSYNIAYYELLKIIENHCKNKKLRSYKVNTYSVGDYDKRHSIFSIGAGSHYIWFHNRLLQFTLTVNNSNNVSSDVEKEEIVIKKLGRSKKIFKEIFNEIKIKKNEERENALMYVQYDRNCWDYPRAIYKRSFDTIYLDKSKKDKLIEVLDNFKNKESWYKENDIPYHLGILLYGSPGTGKTSIIKAIASYYNYSIYTLSASNMEDIYNAINRLPKKSIFVIEDIDCQSLVKSREDPENKDNDKNKRFTLSDILNALDGLSSKYGTIFIATTNHIDKLDPALLRPGRIDLKLEIDYVTLEALNQFLDHFYNQTVENIEIRNNITTAQLQQKLLENYSFEDIVDWCKNKEV